MKASEWPRSKLDDLTEKDRSITYGVVKPGDHDVNGVRFIRGGDVLNGKINIAALRTITQEISQQYKRTLLRGGELLVSLVGNPGEVAIAPNSLNGANIARQVGLIALNHTVHAPYVMYFLISDSGRRELFAQTTGSVQKVINLADLKNVRVPLPPLPIQCKIAAVLSAYDDLIENNTRRIAILEEMAQAIYREWFVHFRFPGHENVRFIESPLGEIPEGWKRPFPGYVDFLEGPGLRRWQYREEGIPFLNIRTIGNNDIDLSKCQFVDPAEVEQKYSHFLLRPLDHIVSSSGTIGRIATVQQNHLPLMLNTSIIRMAPKDEAVGRWQLKHFLQSPYFQNQIVAHASGVAQMNYGPSHLKLMWIIAPDKATGIAYEQHVEAMESLLCSLVKKNTNLRTTRDLLLPKLISGELDVEDLDIETGENAVADASGSDLVCSEAVREGAGRSEPQASTPPRKKQS